MKKLIPLLLISLLCVILTSCSAGAAGDALQPSQSEAPTQPYIEYSETGGYSPSQETEPPQEQPPPASDRTQETTHRKPNEQTAEKTQPQQDSKPAATKAVKATQEPEKKTTQKPVATQAPATKAVQPATQAATQAPTQATTQAPTQEPTLVPEGSYISISINGFENKQILDSSVQEFTEGESVFDLIKKATRANKIHMETKGKGMTAYIAGIDNLYEFDHGAQSGWMYKVNGIFPDVSSGSYKVKPGDIVEFVYSLNMGKDRREG